MIQLRLTKTKILKLASKLITVLAVSLLAVSSLGFAANATINVSSNNTITGTTTPNSKVLLYQNNSSIGSAMSDSSGAYSFSLSDAQCDSLANASLKAKTIGFRLLSNYQKKDTNGNQLLNVKLNAVDPNSSNIPSTLGASLLSQEFPYHNDTGVQGVSFLEFSSDHTKMFSFNRNSAGNRLNILNLVDGSWQHYDLANNIGEYMNLYIDTPTDFSKAYFVAQNTNDNNSLYIFEISLTNGQTLREIKLPKLLPTDDELWAASYGVAVSPDGTKLASISSDFATNTETGKLLIWDLTQASPSYQVYNSNHDALFGPYVQFFEWSPDGSRITMNYIDEQPSGTGWPGLGLTEFMLDTMTFQDQDPYSTVWPDHPNSFPAPWAYSSTREGFNINQYYSQSALIGPGSIFNNIVNNSTYETYPRYTTPTSNDGQTNGIIVPIVSLDEKYVYAVNTFDIATKQVVGTISPDLPSEWFTEGPSWHYMLDVPVATDIVDAGTLSCKNSPSPQGRNSSIKPPKTGAIILSLILTPMLIALAIYLYIAHHNKANIKKRSER